jgi:hypothetical protein
VVAEELGWVPDEALALEVYRATRPGSQSEGFGSAEKDLLPHRAAITEWSKAKTAGSETLRLTKVHRLLERRASRSATRRCGASRSSTASS